MEKFLSIAGNVPARGMTVTSLMWLRKTGPRPLPTPQIRPYHHVSDSQTHRQFRHRSSNAGFNGLYDTVGNTGWSEEMCHLLGFSTDLLATVRNCNEEAGRLTEEASRLTGLPEGTR